MADDKITVTLAAIRENAGGLIASHADEGCRPGHACTGHEAIWCADALEAALKHHRPRQLYQMLAGAPAAPVCEHGDDYDGDAHFEDGDGYWYCRDKPTIKVCISCTDESDGDSWAEWPCPTFSDIATALLGEAQTGGV